MERAKVTTSTKLWRRLIFSAVQDAKKTHCGVPTGRAIMAYLWLRDNRPARTNTAEWETCFECCCEMIGRDPGKLRAHLLGEIDAAIKKAGEAHLQTEIYWRRAMVLTCAGIPTAIARQYLMPLVDEQSYEDVAGIDHGDQYVLYDRRELVETG